MRRRSSLAALAAEYVSGAAQNFGISSRYATASTKRVHCPVAMRMASSWARAALGSAIRRSSIVSHRAARSQALARSVRPGRESGSALASTTGAAGRDNFFGLPSGAAALEAASVTASRSNASARRRVVMTPNVRAKPTAEADAGWPRRDDTKLGLERPDGGCRSGSAP